MNHSTASAAELAADHDFIQWVKYPTSESNTYWNNFMEAYPDRAGIIAEARHLVQLLSQDEADDQVYDEDLQLVWQQLENGLQQDRDTGSDTGRTISLWRSLNRSWLAAAAAVLLLLLSTFVFFQLRPERQVVYATTFGERKTIQLPDNSVIVLNANSIVTIPEKWSSDAPRQVQLTGEAFFSVTHQANDQKFIVTTSGGTQIDVLGTEFSVYDRGHENKIVLASGKVSLQVGQAKQSRQLEMQPGDLVSITADAGIVRRQVNPSLYTAWKEDKIYFDDSTLGEVASMLEHHYGYQVVFGSKALAGQKMTAFLEVKGPDDILSTISETFDVTVSQKEKTIYISSL